MANTKGKKDILNCILYLSIYLSCKLGFLNICYENDDLFYNKINILDEIKVSLELHSYISFILAKIYIYSALFAGLFYLIRIVDINEIVKKSLKHLKSK